MRTIDKILKELNVTKDELEECYNKGFCNGCGGKGGINYTHIMQSLPFFQKGKGKKLERDLFYLCCWHDIQFYKGGNLIDFFVANLIFSVGVYRLLHWTLFIVRLFFFIMLYLLLNLLGVRYFNWGGC